MGRRSDIDWQAIEADYRTGLLSDIQLAKKHGVSRSTLLSHVKTGKWKKDLTHAVEQATRIALIEQAFVDTDEIGREIGQKIGQNREILGKSAVEAAAMVRVAVLSSHQKLADDMKTLAQLLYMELQSVTTGKPKDIQSLIQAVASGSPETAADLHKVLSLPSRVMSAKNLVDMVSKTADMERKAHQIKDDTGQSDDGTIDDLILRVNQLATGGA